MSKIVLPNGFQVDEEQVRSIFSLDPHVTPSKQVELFFNSVDLRDGQQATSYSPEVNEAVDFAISMVRFGVNGIEAGNAAASDSEQTEQRKIRAIAEQVGSMELPRKSKYGVHPRITSLARLFHDDVVSALQSVQEAPNRGVHAYMAHSEIQFPYKYNGLRKIYNMNSKDFEEFIEKVVLPTIDSEFKHIKDTDPECHIRYSPEDWTRTRPEIAMKVILKAVECGANCINLPDTLGVGNPFVATVAVQQIRKMLDEYGFQHVTIAWHGHNDTTMAVANTMGAILGGAREIDTTFLGTGERCGNTATEGTVHMLDTQHPFLEQALDAKITDTLVRNRLVETSNKCAYTFRVEMPDQLPISGRQAYEVGSGGHQASQVEGEADGKKTIYLPTDPETYGTSVRYVIRPESGRGGLKQLMRNMNLPFGEDDLTKFARRMKQICDKHRSDLRQEEVAEYIYYPTVIEITGGPFVTDVAIHEDKSVTLTIHDGSAIEAKKQTGGAIDATIQALRKIIPSVDIDKTRGAMKHVDRGEGSKSSDVARARITNGITVTMHAEHTDTERAGVLAVISAFNAMHAREKYEAKISESASD